MKGVLERRSRPSRAADVHSDGEVSEVFRRLSTAEQKIGDLSEQIVGVSTQLRHQDQQLNTIESQLSAIATSVQQSTATDWKTLAAWATVLLAVVALYTNLNLAPIKEAILDSRADRVDLRNEVKAVSTTQAQSVNAQVEAAEIRGRNLQRLDEVERELKMLHVDVQNIERRVK